MRLFKKYKHFLKLNYKNFPLRIFKFKRSKWKKIKKNRLKNQIKILNYTTTQILINRWDKLKQFYKNKLKTHLMLKHRYCGVLSNYSNKNIKLKTSLLINLFIKNELRVDVLFWRMHLTSSIYETHDLVKRKLIQLNNIVLKTHNYILKSGDIITIKGGILNKFKIRNLQKEFLFSFLEIDYYTQTIIVLKDMDTLTVEDINCCLQDNYPLLFLK